MSDVKLTKDEETLLRQKVAVVLDAVSGRLFWWAILVYCIFINPRMLGHAIGGALEGAALLAGLAWTYLTTPSPTTIVVAVLGVAVWVGHYIVKAVRQPAE